MKKVLFVCLGNICRSPMAEAIFRQRLIEENLEQEIEVDSAAISRWEVGNLPHRGTQGELKKHHIDFAGIRSRQITEEDFVQSDWIIGMDEMNISDLKHLSNEEDQEKINLFLSVVPGKETQEVPDPYYTGDFALTYQLINEGIEKWLEIIRKA